MLDDQILGDRRIRAGELASMRGLFRVPKVLVVNMEFSLVVGEERF